MESWPEKKPHKNRFDNKPSRRASSNRLQGGPLALPTPEASGRRKLAGESTGRLLQIGCREGNFLLNVKNKFGAVYGTDTSRGFLKEAARRRLPVAFSNGENLPYGGASLDFLVAFDAKKLMAEPERFLAEASRVLKKGGEMILTFPSRLEQLVPPDRGRREREKPNDWPSLFEAAGLEVYLSGTDALWDSPSFPAVPSFSQTLFFSGLFQLYFLIEPFFPWQFGDNHLFWLKKK